jgi:hypothetical protein
MKTSLSTDGAFRDVVRNCSSSSVMESLLNARRMASIAIASFGQCSPDGALLNA